MYVRGAGWMNVILLGRLSSGHGKTNSSILADSNVRYGSYEGSKSITFVESSLILGC